MLHRKMALLSPMQVSQKAMISFFFHDTTEDGLPPIWKCKKMMQISIGLSFFLLLSVFDCLVMESQYCLCNYYNYSQCIHFH